MAKNNSIKLEVTQENFVIGIASNEKIWRLCWEINQELGLDLSSQKISEEVFAAEAFIDTETDPYFEFSLLERDSNAGKIPKIAKEFRFWLVIKPRKSKKPDIDSTLQKLKNISSISLAVNLTAANEEKNFLP